MAVKTHLQACSACSVTKNTTTTLSSSNGIHATTGMARQVASNANNNTTMWGTMRYLMTTTVSPTTNNTTTGVSRLLRGVQAILLGCVPAHALYFSLYEGVKKFQNGQLTYVGSLVAGGAATMGHDVIMTPLDTIKQRMQLGHYNGLSQAFSHMIQNEGTASLFRSFPVTLLTNIPYGMLMISTKELLEKQHVSQDPLTNTLLASSVGGAVAASFTTPLDRIKTFLQTQNLQPTCVYTQGTCPKINFTDKISWRRAVEMILEREGAAGFWRGLTPRVLSHTPAVAVSWTAYATFQQWLANMMN
jgi:solute carrier family 25 iron transporter 28/37